MNPDQLDLARRLAAHPRFEWRPGMLALEDPPSSNWQPGDDQWRIVTGAPDLAAVTSEGDVHEAPYMPNAFAQAVPDLTDAATGGVLWELAGKPQSATYPDETMVWTAIGVRAGGATMAEACARLMLATWDGE